MRRDKSKRNSRSAAVREPQTDSDAKRQYARVLNAEHFGARLFDVDYLSSSDGLEGKIIVNTIFGRFSFVYERKELLANVTHFLKKEMNTTVIKKLYKKALGGIDSYNEEAFDLFERRIALKMEVLPYHLVQQILYAFVSKGETKEVFVSKEKSANRKLWDSLARFYGQSLKQEWIDLKPGPSVVTSKKKRTQMLAFYDAMLPICQSAKSIYIRNRKGDWRSAVVKKHQNLNKDDMENLIRMKPSEVAHLITGKHFKKIIGRDLHGEAEVKRQLVFARNEAKARVRKSQEVSWSNEEYFAGE